MAMTNTAKTTTKMERRTNPTNPIQDFIMVVVVVKE
jgi:hypothetical protein